MDSVEGRQTWIVKINKRKLLLKKIKIRRPKWNIVNGHKVQTLVTDDSVKTFRLTGKISGGQHGGKDSSLEVEYWTSKYTNQRKTTTDKSCLGFFSFNFQTRQKSRVIK